MKRVIAMSLGVLVLASLAFAAEVNVAPGLNTIVDAVNAAAAGDVLILARDAGYPYTTTPDVNVPITVKAADGAGALPQIVPAQNESGGWAGNNFRLYADITLMDLAFSGIRTENDRSARTGSVFSMSADSLTAVFDGCTFVGYGGRTLEPGRDGANLFVTNCIETGNGRSNRVDNGRFIDVRAASVDTIKLQNNTLLNCADRWIRHMLEDASENYVLIDHNTFMNGTGYRPNFQFRNAKELIFTNNIVANPGIMGTTQASIRIDEVEYPKEEGICIFTLALVDPAPTPTVTMKNNNAWIDTRITDILGGLDEAAGDSVETASWFNATLEGLVGADAMMSEPLAFTSPPTIDSLLPELTIYCSGTKGYTNSAFIFRTDEYGLDVDMTYPTDSQSYTAAEGGYPLGDLNWFPVLYDAWKAGTGVESNAIRDFALSQNYPNPFNPETNIAYSLDKNTEVALTVYNMMGQKVRTLVNGLQTVGNYNVSWNGTDDMGQQLPSGVYFSRLEVGSQVSMKKMIMVK